jgi:hypothetical protein
VSSDTRIDERTEARQTVLERVIRFNLVAVGAAIGAMCGIFVWLATVVLLVRGGSDVGLHLNVLGVFFPGYSVSWPGAWIGMVYGFIFGAASGALLYWTYARGLRKGPSKQIIEPASSDGLRPPVLILSGRALGASVGALGALQLLLATNWLVVRGTAATSQNAQLLGQYLPGYTVSPVGSLIGAVQIFAIAFIASLVVADVYNRIVRLRLRA